MTALCSVFSPSRLTSWIGPSGRRASVFETCIEVNMAAGFFNETRNQWDEADVSNELFSRGTAESRRLLLLPCEELELGRTQALARAFFQKRTEKKKKKRTITKRSSSLFFLSFLFGKERVTTRRASFLSLSLSLSFDLNLLFRIRDTTHCFCKTVLLLC